MPQGYVGSLISTIEPSLTKTIQYQNSIGTINSFGATSVSVKVTVSNHGHVAQRLNVVDQPDHGLQTRDWRITSYDLGNIVGDT